MAPARRAAAAPVRTVPRWVALLQTALVLAGLAPAVTATAQGTVSADSTTTLSAAGPTGAIAGVVTLQVEERGERPRRYHRGPYRAAHVDDDEPPPVRSVVVYVDSLPAPPGGWALPDPPPQMRQHHDRFVPHVLPVPRGATVSFPNDDNYYHNVFSVVAGDRFDLGRYGEGDTRLQTFEDPAVVVVRCEIHPGMKAYLLVRDNPFFTVPGDDGRYRLGGVPAGTWTVVAWHPTRGAQRRPVVVRPGQDAVLDLAF